MKFPIGDMWNLSCILLLYPLFRVFNIFKEFCLWKTIEIPIRKKPLKIADYIYSTKVVKGAFGYIDLLIFIPYINIHLITINV